MASPLRSDVHAEPHARVMAWLGSYWAKTPAVRVSDNATVWLDPENDVQPDAAVWREVPGGPRLSAGGHIERAPQLVVEVAASSASYDLHDKKEAYRRAGAQEYVVWRVLDAAIDWFRLEDGRYVRVAPDARGVIESTVFPDLRLQVAKLLAGDLAGVLAELGSGPASRPLPTRCRA